MTDTQTKTQFCTSCDGPIDRYTHECRCSD